MAFDFGKVDMEALGSKSLVIRELFRLHRDWRPSELRDELARLYPGYTVTLPTITAALAGLRDEEANGDEGSFADTLRPAGSPPGPAKPLLEAAEAGIRPRERVAPPAPAALVPALPGAGPRLEGVRKLAGVHRWLRREGVAAAALRELLDLEPDGAALREMVEVLTEMEGEEEES